MYLPYLRGRQNELLALKELINNKLMGDKIIPIIEPVKLTGTLISTINLFNDQNRKLIVIQNPQVGNFLEEIKESRLKDNYYNLIGNKNILKGIIATDNLDKDIKILELNQVQYDNVVVVLNNEKYIDLYRNKFNRGNIPLYTLMPDKRAFRREINANKVILEDYFKKRERNTDYPCEPEFFSADHTDYYIDKFQAFSDYSIIGEQYSESGFAPYAVAIHIVFFNENNELYVKHFVSDSNDSIKNPAKKFSEALRKLIDWKNKLGIDTYALDIFDDYFRKQQYPGLGVVKKLSLMHHIQCINDYLEVKK